MSTSREIWQRASLWNNMNLSCKLRIFPFFLICLVLKVFAGEVEYSFTGSLDSTRQLAIAYIPSGYKNEPRPLLVIAHYWEGSRFTAKETGYYPECESRNWLLVCPELHGKNTDGKTSLASLGAQHDIIDAIKYMQKNYKVDSTRIYCAGRSMGGMLAQMMAAKYPDVFAAVVAGQGICDLKLWIDEVPMFKEGTERECGIYSEKTRFEYERRSAVKYAINIRYVPLILWHGTNDTWVPTEFSNNLFKELQKHNPYQVPVFWLQNAAHCATNYPASWVCDQLSVYQRLCESGEKIPQRFYKELDIITDEVKEYFWIGIVPKSSDAFAEVNAKISGDLLSISAKQAQAVSVNLNLIARKVRFSRFTVSSDNALKFSITRDGKTVYVTDLQKNKSGEISIF
jgi:poly(3-hydroxybutyrate) depolymerase